MNDEDKIREQLMNELAEMRRRVADLEAVNTECQRAEEALRESEGQFRELIENANDIIYTHDLEGNFTSANRAATRVYGYTI
jgi:PAS domain-containing protein